MFIGREAELKFLEDKYQDVPLDVLAQGFLRIKLVQVMGNAAQHRIGQHFVPEIGRAHV